jgi:hypothetical protein
MHNFTQKTNIFLILGLFLFLGFISCNTEDDKVEIELEFIKISTKIKTKDVLKTDNFSTVTSGGEFSVIGNDGEGNMGFYATQKGVFWGVSQGFEIDENHKTQESEGVLDFISTITGLDENTTYYVRAYATDGSTTIYANEDKTITTDVNPLNTNPFEGDLNLITQADVDVFDYTSIAGNLTISGADILNLFALNTLIAINGSLSISSNTSLVSVRGLENLSSVTGDLSILNNNVMTTLDGLENISVIGGNIEIGKDSNNGPNGNILLNNLCGVSHLVSNGQIEMSEYFIDNNGFNPTFETIQGDACKASISGSVFTFDSDTEGWDSADESTIISHSMVDGRNVILIESHPIITRTGGCYGDDKVGQGGLDVCIPNVSPNGSDGIAGTSDDNVYLKIVFRNNSNGSRLRIATQSGKVNRDASSKDPYISNPDWPTNNGGTNTEWLTSYYDISNGSFQGTNIIVGFHLVNQDSKSDVINGKIEIDSWELTSTDQY